MSASNWTECPKCKIVKSKALEDAKAKLTKRYGKMPADEYVAAMDRLQRGLLSKNEDDDEREDEFNGEPLREDYEQGVGRDGKFSIFYRADCQQCDFVFTYKHEEQIDFFKKR